MADLQREVMEVTAAERELIEAMRGGKLERVLAELREMLLLPETDYEDDDATIREGLHEGMKDIVEGRVCPASAIWDSSLGE